MTTRRFVLAAALIAALTGCGDDDDHDHDHDRRDAGRTDAGIDGGGIDGGDIDAGDSDGGTTDGGDASADGGAMEAGTDGGDPFTTDGGGTVEILDGAVPPTDAGVSIAIAAAITRQVPPSARNQPAVLEIATLSFYPIELRNPRVNPPPGWRIGTVTEDLDARVCPMPGSGGSERCRQFFVLEIYPDDACSFDGGGFIWTWDVGCAPGGDCATIPSAFETFSLTARPMSGDFCAGLPAPTADPFFPAASLLLPTFGEDEVTIRFVTTIDHPYTLGAGSVVPPTGFTVVSFTEDEALRQCDTTEFPDGCQQWWLLVVTPGTACTARGTYDVTWSVSCETGGDCDPAITDFTMNAALVEDRVLCP